jgi:hypothetical protein
MSMYLPNPAVHPTGYEAGEFLDDPVPRPPLPPPPPPSAEELSAELDDGDAVGKEGEGLGGEGDVLGGSEE